MFPKGKTNAIALAVLALLLLAAGIYWFTRGENVRPRLDFVSTLAGSNGEFGEPFGTAVKGTETYVSDGEAGKIVKISADGNTVDFASGLDTPSAIVFDASGNLFLVDSGSHTIKSISPNGEIQTIAGIASQNGSTDGDATTSLFNGPVGMAASPEGKIFVADTYNDRIRLIENGQVSTIAGSKRGFRDGSGNDALFDTPLGVAVWKGRLLVADSGNKRIRVVEPDGTVWTLAGTGESDLRDGLLTSAAFVDPTTIAVDAEDNIYIADGNAIRRIGGSTFPTVTTIAGGQRGFQDGAAHSSKFNRISGLVFNAAGDLLISDSENRVVRKLFGKEFKSKGKADAKGTPQPISAEEFRKLHPPRWPFDPPDAKRDIAGTLGEIRGEIVDANSQVWFHNGLDIAGAYGETARFIRNEKVLDPNSAENFATLRELLRLPTVGYIHLRLGRDQNDKKFGDPRFVFNNDESGRLAGVRVPRGAKFNAGEAIGTLNAMNHVHLIAGRSGAEMNALAALELPGISDAIAPTIESVSVFDENWSQIETKSPDSRIKLQGKYRIIVRAFDRMDGNPGRRRLGVYKVGIAVDPDGSKTESQPEWKIVFDRMPSNDLVKIAYGTKSHSGATGETIFNYIVTNRLNDQDSGEGFLDTSELEAGNHTISVFASDFFGNISNKQILIEVTK
jgi:sugar lactone lactonase YvrE